CAPLRFPLAGSSAVLYWEHCRTGSGAVSRSSSVAPASCLLASSSYSSAPLGVFQPTALVSWLGSPPGPPCFPTQSSRKQTGPSIAAPRPALSTSSTSPSPRFSVLFSDPC